MEPHFGDPGDREDEVWVFFDATERRHHQGVESDKSVAPSSMRCVVTVATSARLILSEFSFDTFRDRRNAILLGSQFARRSHGLAVHERQFNPAGIGVGNEAGAFEGGWTIEGGGCRSKSIRYARPRAGLGLPGAAPTSRRTDRVLTKLPPSLGLGRADFSASLYASLVGMERRLLRGRSGQTVCHHQPDDG